jgi:hypothetical protein
LRILPIWKAKAEPKCKIFAWTLLHKKILTTNSLIKRNWSNDTTCKLCCINPETPTHLCEDCVLTKEVWSVLKQWLGLSVLDKAPMGGIHSQLLAKMPRKNFLEHIDATKTSSFSLQGTNRAAPVGDDES